MKDIILAAGYATRLYPQTINKPKALLEYKGRHIIDYIIEDLQNIHLKEIIIVSNHKFFEQFKDYILSKKLEITLLDDGSTNPNNRLGALCDVLYALDQLKIDDDILIMASDNLLDFSIAEFINYFKIINHSSIMAYEEFDIENLRKTGQAIISNEDVLDFKEKSYKVISNYAVPPFYIFKKEDVIKLKNLKGSFDSLGDIIEKLVHVIHFKCFYMRGKRINLGEK